MLQITQYNISLKLGLQKKIQAFNYLWKSMGVRMGVKTVIRRSFGKLGVRTKISSKPEVRSLIPIKLI